MYSSHKEVTLTGVKNFLHAWRDYQRRLQEYNSNQPNARKTTPIGLKRSITESVLNLICRWQLNLDPADVTEETFSQFLHDFVTRNAQSQGKNSMKRIFDKIKYRMDINEPEPRFMDLWMQWRKALNELNLDDFINTDAENNIWRKNVPSKIRPRELSDPVQGSV
jgi:hypothetical protein